MDTQRKHELQNNLLIWMRDICEAQSEDLIGLGRGNPTRCFINCPFSNENLEEFKKSHNITDKDLHLVINTCKNQNYILEKITQCFDGYRLTELGYKQANKAEQATLNNSGQQGIVPAINIGTLNATNAQVGNNNVQNITNTFSYLIEEINNANIKDEEKKSLLGKLNDVISHPVISGIVGGTAVAAIKTMLGLN